MASMPMSKFKRTLLIVLAFVLVLSSAAMSMAVFTDRVNATTSIKIGVFAIDADGYRIERTYEDGYYSPGETVEVKLKESNTNSLDFDSQITMTVDWESIVPGVYPWGNAAGSNAVITYDLDGETKTINYTVNADKTITFTLPNNPLKGGATETNTFKFQIPSDLAATGKVNFNFDKINLTNGGTSAEYDDTKLDELDFDFDVAWNISKNQGSASSPNRDVIAILTDTGTDGEYGLHVIKNGQDGNTNKGQMMDWTGKDQTPWADYTITDLVIDEKVTSVGDYAFAGETGITSVTLPSTMEQIGTSAFDGSGLTGELVIPASVKEIESLGFGNLPNVDTITFKHGASNSLTLPENDTNATKEKGAFYVPTYVETTINTSRNDIMYDYLWQNDNRRPIPKLAATYSWFDPVKDPDISRFDVSAVNLVDYYIPTGNEFDSWDGSAAQDGSVMVYLEEDTANAGLYKVTVAGNGYKKIFANENSYGAFWNFGSATKIDGLALLDTSKTENMEYMFNYARYVENLDVGHFDTTNVTSMRSMFSGCSAVTSLDVNTKIVNQGTEKQYIAWNTGNVKNMSTLFELNTSLKSLDISKWDTRSVEQTYEMFFENLALKTLDLSTKAVSLGNLSYDSWDTKSLQYAEGMFLKCYNIESINVSTFDMSSVTNSRRMFGYTEKLPGVDVTDKNITLNGRPVTTWDMSSNEDLYGMFQYSGIESIDVSSWDTSKVEDFQNMFYECTSLESLDVSNFDTSKATSYRLSSFAWGCTSLTDITLGEKFGGDGQVASAGSIGGLFYVPSYLETTISGENDFMFNYDWHEDNRKQAPTLAAQDSWYTQGNTALFGLLRTTSAIDKADITSIEFKDNYRPDENNVVKTWDASDASVPGTVTAYVEPDAAGSSKYKLTLSGNGYGLIYANKDSSFAFSEMTNLNSMSGTDVLDTRNATEMNSAFFGNSKMTTLDVSSWNVSTVTTMANMFQGCSSLTEMDLAKSTVTDKKFGGTYTAWNPTALQNANLMFDMRNSSNTGGALEKVDVTGWNTANLESTQAMFADCFELTDITGIDAWNTANIEDASVMFYRLWALENIDVSGWNTDSMTTAKQMFYDCDNLKSVNISDWTIDGNTNTDNMFAFCTTLTELTIPADLTTIGTRFAYGCTNLTKINFEHAAATDITFPTAGETNGAFYVPNYLKTTFSFNGNADAKAYDWITDNRMKIGVISATLKYDDVKVGETVPAQLTINPTNYDTPQKITYSVKSGSEAYASVNAESGTVTGLKEGKATIIVTIIDANGNTVTAEGPVNVINPKPVLAAQQTWYTQGTTVDTRSVTSITIQDDPYTPGSGAISWDASDGQKGTIHAYLEETSSGSGTYKLTIAGNGYGSIYTNTDSSLAFSYFTTATSFTGLDVLDTSETTKMNQMFYWCGDLTSLNVNTFNTTNVTTMSNMFGNCEQLTSLDVSKFDTRRVTNMSSMFYNCAALTSLNTSSVSTSNSSGSYTSWDTSAVQGMRMMFYNCLSMPSFDVSNFNTAKVEDMSYMFAMDESGSANKSITFGNNFNTAKVEDMSYMFFRNENLPALDVTGFDTSNVENMQMMFDRCSSLTTLDVSGFKTGKVTTMEQMFNQCAKLETIDISNWDMSLVTENSLMFNRCTSLKSLTIPGTLTTFSNQFAQECSSLTAITFKHASGTSISFPTAGSATGAFTLKTGYSAASPLRTKVTTSNANVLAYDWTTDARGYTVTVKSVTGGTVTASTGAAINGKTVTFTTTASSGYTYCGATVKYTEDGTAKTMNLASNVKTFTMPAADVTITPTWKVGVTKAALAYDDVYVSQTVPAQLTITPTNYDTLQSKTYAVIDGGTYASVDENTGVVTGLAQGTATVRVTIVDAIGVTVTADAEVNVKSMSVLDANTEWFDDSISANKYQLLNKLDHTCSWSQTWNEVKNHITEFHIVQEAYTPSNALATWDASELKDGSITAYLERSDIETKNSNGCEGFKLTLSGNGNGKIFANPDSYQAFYNINARTFSGFDNIDTRLVTDMSSMFYMFGAYTLETSETLDLSSWDTSNVTKMTGMFSGIYLHASASTYGGTINVSGWDTSNVTDMASMFVGGAYSYILGLDTWDTKSVTSMDSMFSSSSVVLNNAVSKWDTSNVESMYMMFAGCPNIGNLDLSYKEVTVAGRTYMAWDTSKLTNIGKFMYDSKSIPVINLNGWKLNSTLASFDDSTCAFCMSNNGPSTVYVSDQTTADWVTNMWYHVPEYNHNNSDGYKLTVVVGTGISSLSLAAEDGTITGYTTTE